MIKLYNRQTKEFFEEKEQLSLRFLYHTILGRMILKLLIKKPISKITGKILNSKLSVIAVKPFIKKNCINMSDYKVKKYSSFNDFFTRKIKKNTRSISPLKKDFVSVADSKLSVYKIDSKNCLKIKNSFYTVEELVKDKELAETYRGGYVLVFRLSVEDYHHYIYNDEGKTIYTNKIDGVLHTVNPLAFKQFKVFCENSREYSVLETSNFGTIVQIEVGALNVGKIRNNNLSSFKRGDEKGYFEFGGSTIVLLVKKDILELDKDILKNSKDDVETIVKLGDTIGHKKGQ